MYLYAVSLVTNDAEKASFQNQAEVYSNSFVNLGFSIDSLRDPSFVLDSSNIPADFIINYQTEDDLILRVKPISGGKTILTTFKIT